MIFENEKFNSFFFFDYFINFFNNLFLSVISVSLH
jgi:hypothetical protein